MDYTLVYFGIAFFILCLILDEVLARSKIPSYFRSVIKLRSVDWELLKLQYSLPPASQLQDILRSKIKNKFNFYTFSQKEIFFKEFQYDYGVARYSVVPIHGSIEIANPQRVRITICLNLVIPGMLFCIFSILFVRFSFKTALWALLIIGPISAIFYYYRINNRVKLLVNSVDEWLKN